MPYKDKDKQKEYKRVWVLKRRRALEYLKAAPCSDCGNVFPPECMDFDHVRGDKQRNVAALVSVTLEAILNEIAKCDLVCANCHRIRTRRRHGRLARR